MTTLRVAVQQYLSLRRGLGFKLHEAGKLLHKFVIFMEHHHASVITTRLALDWARETSSVQQAEWARRLSIVRGFARHRSATDSRTEIPPDGLFPYRPKRARPYLYSNEEIKRLLRAALMLRGLQPWTYHGLFGLLSVSGMRLGEARNLTCWSGTAGPLPESAPPSKTNASPFTCFDTMSGSRLCRLLSRDQLQSGS